MNIVVSDPVVEKVLSWAILKDSLRGLWKSLRDTLLREYHANALREIVAPIHCFVCDVNVPGYFDGREHTYIVYFNVNEHVQQIEVLDILDENFR